ncbi:MAG TPA: TonB-dependent receptor, partial [Gammaproteobacteria bacterium]|nr:TonB-dependent receptor [Gammaproteobacteria bacterium]
ATQPAHSQQPSQQSLEEVVVTGSRIVRRDLEASSPLMTIDTQRLDQSSTISVETILNQMPQFTPAQSQFSAVGEIQTSPTVSLGIGTGNLRGVGTNRTLVLVDGRRGQPVNASLVVDLNTIPTAAIARVETITGGASAVYGADAMAGVVNFVLKDDFEGVSLNMQTAMSEAGDGEDTVFSALLGMNTDGGDANMLLGVEWYERDVAYQRNRDFYTDGWADPTNIAGTFFPSMPGYQIVAANRPTQAALDAVLGLSGIPAGTVLVTSNPVIYFNKDGTPFVRDATRALGFQDSQLNQPNTGDGFYDLIRQGNRVEQLYRDAALSNPLERQSLFGKGHVDINDNMRAFVQANYVRAKNDTFSAGPPPAVGAAWGGAIPNTPGAPNTKIPAALQTLLDSRVQLAPAADPNDLTGPDETWQLNRGLDFLGQFGPSNDSDVYQIMAGFEGSFPNNDWTWEAYYSTGETTAETVYTTLPSVQRWQSLVAAPNFGTNATIVSSIGGNYQMTCTTGLPIFYGTTDSTSQNCYDAIVGRFKSITNITQDIFEANIEGKIADMKAGELRFAAGVGNRQNGFVYEPANPQASVFDAPLGLFVSNPTAGETEVSEVYGELLVPVTERFEVDFAARYSDYDNLEDPVGTYGVQFSYRANDFMRVRAAVQSASRAPNTAELYQAETAVFQTTFSSADPCGVNTLIPGYGNRADAPNRLQVQQLCAQLIGNTTSTFGAPGSAEANSYLQGQQAFTGINIVQVGNPDVEAESGDTWTLGFVFTAPGSLDGLTASLDFYNIKVEDAIATFEGGQIYDKCFNRNGVSNPGMSINDPGGFCALINRNESTGAAGTVDSRYLNAALIETSGVDMQVNWRGDTAGGELYVNALASFLNEYNTKATKSDPVLEFKGTLGGGGQYDYRLNTTVGYNFGGGNAGVGVRWRYLPEVKNGAYVTNRATLNLPTEDYSGFDAFASYSFNERFQLRGGIDNLLNTDPAIVGATPTDSNSSSTLAGYYDTLGRRFYVGLRMDF